MSKFKCSKCNTVIECNTCGSKYCPNCNTLMTILTRQKEHIEGFCSKCNYARYIATLNDKVIYNCDKANIQIKEVLDNCIAL